MIKVVAVGDIMPGGLLHGESHTGVSKAILSLLKEGDIRVGTLECAIGNEADFVEEKMKRYGDVIYAPDEDIRRIVEMNINVVSLANNHFFDLKEKGAIHTIQLLDELGILHCGAGRNIKEAQRPAFIHVNGKKIAVLAFCDHHRYMGWVPIATETTAGINPMYDDYVVDQIKKIKKESDYVLVMPHWGREHTYDTTAWCYKIANKMVKAGADLILGSHPHRVQPVVNKHKKSIVFSMGNFLFPDRLIAPPLRATYYSNQTIMLSSLPVTDKYPAVEEITYKKWKPLARYGMITLTTISSRSIFTKYKLTHLGEDNIVVEAGEGEKEIEKVLKRHEILLKYTPYRLTLFIKGIIISIISLIKHDRKR